MRGQARSDGSHEEGAGAERAGGPREDSGTLIAACRAFFDVKQLFLRAAEDLDHPKRAWLRDQVRAARDPIHLWLLRRPLLDTLWGDDRATSRGLRAELCRSPDGAAVTHGAGADDSSTLHVNATPANPPH